MSSEGEDLRARRPAAEERPAGELFTAALHRGRLRARCGARRGAAAPRDLRLVRRGVDGEARPAVDSDDFDRSGANGSARWMARSGRPCPARSRSRTVPPWWTNQTTPDRARSPCWMRGATNAPHRGHGGPSHSGLGDRVPIRQPLQLLVPTGRARLRRSERRAHGERGGPGDRRHGPGQSGRWGHGTVVLDGSSIEVQVDDVSVFLLTNDHCLGATKTGLVGFGDPTGASWEAFRISPNAENPGPTEVKLPPEESTTDPLMTTTTTKRPANPPGVHDDDQTPGGLMGVASADHGPVSARLPYLDGYRAVAATAVVLYHSVPWITWTASSGGMGSTGPHGSRAWAGMAWLSSSCSRVGALSPVRLLGTGAPVGSRGLAVLLTAACLRIYPAWVLALTALACPR